MVLLKPMPNLLWNLKVKNLSTTTIHKKEEEHMKINLD